MLIKKLGRFKKFLEIELGVFAVLLLILLVLISHNPKTVEVKPDSLSENAMAEMEGLAAFEEQIANITKTGEETAEEATQENKEETAPASENGTDASTSQENSQNNQEATSEENQGTQETAVQEADEPEVPRADLIIGIVADAHAGQENGWQKLSTFAWKMANYEYPDIIVDLGDLIESRYHYKDVSRDSAMADYRKARSIISRYPVYNVIGNHEILSMSKEDLQNLTGRKNYYSASVNGYNIR